jgi:16S rRNA G966 N2-methylase RsmD/nitroreductase
MRRQLQTPTLHEQQEFEYDQSSPYKEMKIQDEKAAEQLLKILSMEIAQDGGASQVLHLKDYAERPKLVDSLLLQSIGNKKLLAFLECQPHIFHVDRYATPHFVKLISKQHCYPTTLNDKTNSNTIVQKGLKTLNDKVLYVLRKRASKLARRQRPGDTQNVSITWLMNQVTAPLHYYLRSSGYYVRVYHNPDQVKMLGTPEWQQVVLPEFESLLLSNDFEIDILENYKHVVWLPGTDHLKDTQDDYFVIRQLASKLTELVHEDGATQVTLSLLLHRYVELQQLLGGRDFALLAEQYDGYFTELIITKYGDDIHLQAKNPARDGGRMQVDETGLFSVASSKWGGAFANLMAWSCTQAFQLDAHKVTAIDLTASVGGITLALAKASFAKVIAVEIDPHRADLCRKNMLKHGMNRIVDVRTADAMDQIRVLGICNKNQSTAVVIDPPWGGIHYKREKKPIYLGRWALEEVVEAVAHHLSPAVVGLRLPVNFPAHDFLETLRLRDLSFETTTIRKVGPQLIAILAFQDVRR